MMRAFLSIKFYESGENRSRIDEICESLQKIGIETFVYARDISEILPPRELMQTAFREIDKSDIFILDASEPSIGAGIETGYAMSKNIPIYAIAKTDTYVSNTVLGVAKEFMRYETPSDLTKLQDLLS